MIDRWAALVARRARLVLVVGILLTLGAAGYGVGVFDSLSQGGFDDKDSESARALELEHDTFGNRGVDVVVIFSAESGDDLTANEPAFRDAVAEVVDSLPADQVADVVPYFAVPEAPGMVSADGRSAQVLVSLAGETQDDYLDHYQDIEPLLTAPEGSRLQVDVAGPFAVFSDVSEITAHDLKRAEILSMPIVILLAFLIFGSLVAASMPAVVGLVALFGGLAIMRVITLFTDVSIFAINVVSLIGIGMAIDYALFVISRFREELAKLPDDDPDAARTAIRRTMPTAGRTVLFSGLTVAAAMASLLVFPQAFLRSMAYGGVAAVLVAMLASLTVLPAALVLLGRRVDAGRLPWRRGRPVATTDAHGRWAALARAVMRRPVLVIVAIVAVLLFIASPFLGVKWGSVDYRVLPADAPSHEAAALLNEKFGAETSTATVVLDQTAPEDLGPYFGAVAELDDVTAVAPIATEGSRTLLRVTWEGNSQSERSQDVVEAIRAIDPGSGRALVGGQSAATVDLVDSIGAHLPWMALIVVVVMLVLLFLAFGSLVLPVKAVLMNLLSISASFGVVTWIFSDGHLSGLLGFEPPGYLDATNPILMLAVLFGLSMDYEVFLLSRVREQWDRTHDNDLAVATGVQKTGRIITSAALLLAVVIGAFGTSGIVFMKMLGIGMLVALLIDATIVRAMLVPATMKLLGRWNWWAPAPMRRWWERYGFREEAGDAAAPGAESDALATPR
ncbi:MMPL family transporter [Nocardioides sp. GXZ039]|uniref:MMPL family transporter n=1 Tax=Nocardioides sp. GXZ039 TaxID=3136018 RepID=UPI0030F442E1